MESSIRGNWGDFVDLFREVYVSKDIIGCKRSAVLWIDERTGDYFVAWIFDDHDLFTYKKGDDSWWNGGTDTFFWDLAYKKSKLYLYTYGDYIKIIDFSGDSPKEVIEKNPYRDHPFHYHISQGESIWERRIAIEKSGEVLIILSLMKGVYVHAGKSRLFNIFKMNLESNEWERVDSIGDDEMLIFGHGLTIRAPVQDVGYGIKSGSICFVKDDLSPGNGCPSNCGVFDLATSNITWHGFSWKSRWFVPGF